MAKQKRDGSATIRRAKVTMATAELKQAFKAFVSEPTASNLESLQSNVWSYQEVAIDSSLADAPVDTLQEEGQAE